MLWPTIRIRLTVDSIKPGKLSRHQTIDNIADKVSTKGSMSILRPASIPLEKKLIEELHFTEYIINGKGLLHTHFKELVGKVMTVLFYD